MALFSRAPKADASPRPPKRLGPGSDRDTKPKKAKKPQPITQDVRVSPFLADHTQAGLADRFNELRARRADSVLVAVCLALCLMVSLGMNVFQASRSHIEPYMVVVDGAQGFLLDHGALQPMGKVEDIYLQRELRDIISGLRTVTNDRSATNARFKNSYDKVKKGSPGDAFMKDYFLRPGFHPTDLIGRGGQRTVVEFTGPAKVAGTRTWSVQWIERTAVGGMGVTEDLYRGSFTMDVLPVTTVESAERNPLGVWIDGAQWEKVSSKYLDLEELGDATPMDLLYPDDAGRPRRTSAKAAPGAQPATPTPAAAPSAPAGTE